MTEKPTPASRRQFIKTGAAFSTLSMLGTPAFGAHHNSSDKLRVGLIGCGGRGTGAAFQCIDAAPNMEMYAMADFFQDKLDACAEKMVTKGWQNHAPMGKKYNVTPERQFTGFDGYQKVIDSGVDLVVIATQPGFRPIHFEAAIKAGKHVFMEKPVAVDPVGVRKVIEVSELAKQKNLTVVAGTQRRHDPAYLEMMKRVKDGAIGDLRGGDGYWIWGKKIGQNAHNPDWSEMEFQIRNWYFHCWGSGDCIVEQHIHQLDVLNWAFGGPPKSAIGSGGLMIHHDFGNIYDHFSVVYEYDNGIRVMSMCSQIPGTTPRIGERLVGANGIATAGQITGKKEWKYTGPEVNGQEQEHKDLIASIRGEGPYLNDGKRIAESTMTAILGRMCAYTGREISFGWALNRSKLDLSPARYAIGPNPIPPRPIPGETPLV